MPVDRIHGPGNRHFARRQIHHRAALNIRIRRISLLKGSIGFLLLILGI